MREKKTEDVIPAKHVTDAALTFQRKRKKIQRDRQIDRYIYIYVISNKNPLK